MTPEQKATLQQHVDATLAVSAEQRAEILYTDSDPEALETLAGIETTVREKMLEHVSPGVGSCLSKARLKQQPEESES